MKNLSIFHRLLLIVLTVSVAFGAILAVQIWSLRDAIIKEREVKIVDLVNAAIATIKAYDAEAAAGHMSLDAAKATAAKAIGAMRWGEDDYFAIYDDDGLTIAHGNPAYVGKNRIDFTTQHGEKVVRILIDLAKAGGGFTEFMTARASGGPESMKRLYSAPYAPWRWAIQTGVYIDDVDAVMEVRVGWIIGEAIVVMGIAIAAALYLGRGITVPLSELCSATESLAAGNVGTIVPFTERTNETGRIARAVEVFKGSMIEGERLRTQQEEVRRESEARSRQTVLGLADDLDRSVGRVVTAVTTVAGEMRRAAGEMSKTAADTTKRSTKVATAADLASSNVQTVAVATEELSSSVLEISRQMTQSQSVAERANADTERTNVVVEGLAESAVKIGEVVRLINDIASQTNLLALNATIEAARAGEAGKGFAVVASEVKALANQTGRATEEIAGQVGEIQAATREAVSAIRNIGSTISELNQIGSSIAAAIEQQGAATQEIARNVQAAAAGTSEVTTFVSEISREVGANGERAAQVSVAADGVERDASHLRGEVDRFLANLRKA